MALAMITTGPRSGIRSRPSARSVQKEDYKNRYDPVKTCVNRLGGDGFFCPHDFLEKIKSAGLRKHSVCNAIPPVAILAASVRLPSSTDVRGSS